MSVIFLLFAAYFIWLIVINYTWWRKSKNEWRKSDVNHFYSVVIPIRNEAANLKLLLDSLGALDFPKDKFEVILIDDHSDENEVEVYKQLIREIELDIIMHSLEEGEGKKKALALGIDLSKGEVIVTTDGDCVIRPHWLFSIAYHFEKDNINMVFGGVTFFSERSFFQKLQTIEFSSLIGAGATSLSLGMPNMCNGANLAFRKDMFFKVGGYSDNDHIPSGDDEFLMHKFYRLDPSGVVFNYNSDSVVSTLPNESFATFFNQRKRWASKWRAYESSSPKYTALLIGLVNIVTIILFILCAVSEDRLYYMSIVFIKLVLEGIFLNMVARFLGKGVNLIHYLFLFIVYPFYVVYFGVASNFGTYLWKGRKH